MLVMKLMHRSIPAVNIPPPGIHTSFLPEAPGFPPESFARGRSLDWVKFFSKLIKIYGVLLFLVNVFKRLLRKAGKTLVFFHNNCICLLQHLFLKFIKSNNIVF